MDVNIYIFTLSMSPLKKITNLNIWIKFRRMLGLFAFFYASIHMLTYVGLDYRFDFESLMMFSKKYLFLKIYFCCLVTINSFSITSSIK